MTFGYLAATDPMKTPWTAANTAAVEAKAGKTDAEIAALLRSQGYSDTDIRYALANARPTSETAMMIQTGAWLAGVFIGYSKWGWKGGILGGIAGGLAGKVISGAVGK